MLKECGCRYETRTGLSPVAFGIALGLIYGLSLLLYAWLVHFGGYNDELIVRWGEIMRGYAPTVAGGLIGFVWGLVEGFITGVIFSWLYNLVLCCCRHCWKRKEDVTGKIE